MLSRHIANYFQAYTESSHDVSVAVVAVAVDAAVVAVAVVDVCDQQTLSIFELGTIFVV